MQQLEPARPRRFAQHDLRHIVGARVAKHVVGSSLVAAGNGHWITAERLSESQRVGNAIAFLLVEPSRPAALDKQRRERGVQSVRQTLRVTHETGGTRVFADANEDALASRPRARDGTGLHLGQELFIDPLGGAAQRKLA